MILCRYCGLGGFAPSDRQLWWTRSFSRLALSDDGVFAAVWGYASGTFSNRKLEQATRDGVPYRYICADQYPDHDRICAFRKRFLKDLEGIFVQVLVIARQKGVLKLGTVSLDGTRLKANASKHEALSWQYAKKREAQLGEQVATLMQLAEAPDNSALPQDVDIPEEIKRRELMKVSMAHSEIISVQSLG